jgi:adenylate kinase
MILLFIGPSGSGKDTQAQFLVDEANFKRISTGDLIRELIEGDNTTQNRIRENLMRGFSPDSFVFGLLEIYMMQEASENIVFSGTVRRVSQVKLFDDVLSLTDRKVDKVIIFELSDEESVERMTSRYRCPVCSKTYNLLSNPPHNGLTCDIDGATLTRREDDNEESIKIRLAEYHKDADGIALEYEKRGILTRINANRPIEEVRSELFTLLGL